MGKIAERSITLPELLTKMQPRVSQELFYFADFWKVMEKRGFGPMLALPSFVACSPLGAKPGITSLSGVTILLIALQILLGSNHPWLPRKIMDIHCNANKLRNIVTKVKPHAAKIDRFLNPRCFFMRKFVFRFLIALNGIGCGLVMIP